MSEGGASEVVPTSLGDLSRLMQIPLDRVSPGEYELLLNVRDEISGREQLLMEPLTLTEAAREFIGKRLAEDPDEDLVFFVLTQPSSLGFNVGVGFEPRGNGWYYLIRISRHRLSSSRFEIY